MALIKCEDCGKDISNKAKACPNCGCPIPPKMTKVIVHRIVYHKSKGIIGNINKNLIKIYIDGIDYGNLDSGETKTIEYEIGKHLFKVDYMYNENEPVGLLTADFAPNNIVITRTKNFLLKENEEFNIYITHIKGKFGYDILFNTEFNDTQEVKSENDDYSTDEKFEECFDEDGEPIEKKIKGINC